MLPVPQRPDTNQSSSMLTSLRGTNIQSKQVGLGFMMRNQSAKSQPLENFHRPVRRAPPSTSFISLLVANETVEHSRSSLPAQYSSCASMGNRLTCQLWITNKLVTHPLDPHADAMVRMTSTAVSGANS